MTSKFKPMAHGTHSHSDMSLDGAVTPDQRIKRAKELGRVADTLTDHGNMSGLIPHWFAGKKHGIQSIHGIEAYMVDERRPTKEYKNGKIEPRYTHQTILFKTQEAYEYMCKMTPIMEDRAIVKYGESKPLLYYKELEPIADQIALGTGCIVGSITKNINDFSITYAERLQWAEEEYLKLKRLAGNTPLFAEIFPHIVSHNWHKPKDGPGNFHPILEKNHICNNTCDNIEHVYDECGHLTVSIDLQIRANQFIIHMAKKHGDLLMLSEDSHNGKPEDKMIQDMRLGNGQEKWKFYENYAMRDSDYWAKNLQSTLGLSDYDIEEMIDNSYKSLEYFSKYNIRTNKDGWLVPSAAQVYGELYNGYTNKEVIHSLVEKHGRMPKESHPDYQKYKDRLAYEISVLADNGKADLLPYFFPVEEAVQFAKDREEIVNVRGSAGGVLLAYLLGMSITDPLVYDLPFERFLTIGRLKANTPPDCDLDIEIRDDMLEHLFTKYGDNCSLISTELQMKLKSSILDCERAELGEVRSDTSYMAKMLPNPPQGVNFTQWLYGYETPEGDHVDGFLDNKEDVMAIKLNQWIKDNPKTWDTVRACLGITKARGVHAGGVLITPASVYNYSPIIKNKNGPASALNMKWAEEVGLIKYDFLGVSTLKAMGITLRALRKDKVVDLQWGEFPHDPAVYKHVYHTGRLAGIFQVDTNSMRPYVSAIKPNSIKDVSNILSLVRPGCLDSDSPKPGDTRNAAQYYVACAQGKEEPYFIHPELKPIFGYSYGVSLHQEQLLRVFRDLAGYSYETSETVRRGVGKKDKKILDEHMGNLQKACIARGWTEQQAKSLCDMLIASARYSFNCLSPDTEIQTPDGLKKLSDIKDGDTVYGLDLLDEIRAYPVQNKTYSKSKGVKMKLSDGQEIVCTLDHLFLTPDGYKTAKEIIQNQLCIVAV